MKLYVARHGYAGEPIVDDERADDDRPLTEQGRRHVEAVAGAADISPAVIFTSPIRRARETAAIFGRAFAAPVKVTSALHRHDDPEPWLRRAVLGGGLKRVMLVGHVDNLPDMMSELGDDQPVDRLKKGELRAYRIDRDTGAWTERWRITPDDLP
jgi:phosphohistidine phosphatase